MTRTTRTIAAVVALLSATALLMLAGVGSAAAATQVDFGYEIECNDGDAAIEISFEFISGDPDEEYSVFFNGQEIDESPVSPGQHVFQATASDGVFAVEVKNSGGSVIANPKFPVTCDAPIVDAVGSCEDGEGNEKINVALWDQSPDWTYTVSVDGAAVLTEVDGVANLSWYAIAVEPGAHLVEVDWLDDKTDDPIYSAEVADGCNPDAGSGFPDVGSDSAPIALAAGALVAIGAALLGIRRSHLI